MHLSVVRRLRTRRRDERGAAAIVAVFAALLSLAFAALAVDLGNALARKGATQAQADLAALAGAKELPGSKSATDPAVLQVADYLIANRPQDDRDTDWPTTQTAMAQNLVDGNDVNGEVYFESGSRMRVVSPRSQVNFGFAGVFDLFDGGVADQTEVAGDATVMVGSPDALGGLPMYVAEPSPGEPACDYGLQTFIDPPGGHTEPASVPTLYANSDTNSSTLEGIEVTDGGVATSSIGVNSTTGQVTVDGDFTRAVRVGFFRSDDPTVAPVEVLGPPPANTDWVSPASTPYSQNNGSITVKVPSSVTAVNALWYVRVYQGGTGTGADKWSAPSHAQPLSVGDAPYECTAGSSDGNFGTLKFPRSTSPSGWIPRNIALGLEAPLSLGLMPGNPPPWMCTASTTGAVISTASNRRAGTNCLDTDTGLTDNTATEGFITGGSYSGNKGLLATGASSPDPDGSGGCSPAGTTASLSLLGRQLNNDILTCYLTDTTTTLGSVARRSYSGGPVFHPAIYESPRFAWVPVFKQETQSGGSGYYSIVDFRAAFITDQPMSATKANNAVNSGTSNGLDTHGGKLAVIKVVFLNPNALPDGQAQTPIGPYLGVGPKTTRLVD